MNKTELFQTIRKQAEKVFPIVGSSNQANKNKTTAVGEVIEGSAQEKHLWDTEYQDLQQLFRHQFPSVTKQLLGRRYNTINKVSRFVLPNGMDQAADELLELLSDFASGWASTDAVLSATGCKQIDQLTKDVQRSQRAGFALKEVNKAMAAVQGAFSGATGLLGAAIDLPASVIFSLKTIYEIGHSYGFELESKEDQKAVYFALSQMDLGLIAEKQALFLVLRSFKNLSATGDLSQIQSFLNSNYGIEQFNSYLVDENGDYKWSVLNLLTKLKALRFVTPVVGGAVGAFYNVKLVEEVAVKADEFFAQARHYFKDNPQSAFSILDAYEAQQQKLAAQAELLLDASPLLSAPTQTDNVSTEELQAKAVEAIDQHDTIVDVEVKVKAVEETPETDVLVDISQGIQQLAADNIVDAESESEQLKDNTEQSDVVETATTASDPQEDKSEQQSAQVTEVEKTEVVAKGEEAKTTDEEDLTKDLAKLVKVHTEKSKLKSEPKSDEVSSEDVVEEVVEEAVEESTEESVDEAPVSAEPKPAVKRKPAPRRSRKKAVSDDNQSDSTSE